MKRVIVLYGQPKDPEAFEKHYQEVHIPLVRQMPNLKGFEYSRGKVAVAGDADYYMVAMLTFESGEALKESFASEAGKATVGDVGNFASGGATIVTVGTTEGL